MKRLVLICSTLALSALLSGCNPQARGFALPPGDAEAGKTAFTELGCNACHSVKGTIERLASGGGAMPHIVLGGETTHIKTYGELVTSIIHPSHKLSKRGPDAETKLGTSRMPNFNETMTVQQMIDLTAMLQGAYSVIPPRYTYYAP